jgi:hypothetical protein
VSYITTTKSSAPAAPASGKASVYNDTADARVKVLDGTYGITTILTNSWHRNWLMNGGFWFAQRQAPATPTAYTSVGGRVYAADRWWVSNESASVNYSRTDTVGALESGLTNRFYGVFSKITNATKFAIGQVLDGTATANLRGHTMRFVCKMKADSARTFRLGVIQLTSAGTVDTVPSGAGLYITAWGLSSADPTLGTNLSYIAPKSGITYPNGTVSGNAVNCSVTTSWQQFSVVFDVPTTAKNLILSVWSDAGATSTLNISEASLVDDQGIPDWSYLSMEVELMRCQRFYCKTFAVDTAPAQNAGAGTGEARFVVNVAATGAGNVVPWRFPVAMRATPTTVTLFNPSAANAQVRNITGALDHSASSSSGATDSQMFATSTGNAGGTVGQITGVHITAEAEL